MAAKAKDVLRVGAFQLAPVLFNKKATIEKILVELDKNCRGKGLDFVAFSEGLIPGYPFHIDSSRSKQPGYQFMAELQAHCHKEAVRIDDGDLDPICAKAKELSLSMLVGVIETDASRGNALFCTSVFIGKDGAVRNVHRKLMPTYDERKVWSIGDAHGLKTQKVEGFQISTLNCWENWMPLPRAALYGQGTQLHVALWPGSTWLTDDITRFIAKEGRLYCLSVSGVLRQQDVRDDVPRAQELRQFLADRPPWFPPAGDCLTDGGSCLAGPDSRWVEAPVVGGEKFFMHDLEMEQVRQERFMMDVGGHYARPDVFSLRVNDARATNVHFQEQKKDC